MFGFYAKQLPEWSARPIPFDFHAHLVEFIRNFEEK